MTETLVSWCSRSAEPRDRPALLEVSGLTKSFGPLTVLREVSLQVSSGEIVAVAGGNGAGKSTLIGTIAGVLDAEAGEVRFDGRPMPSRPGQVRRAGVETVWQEHGLCDDLDAVANIFLGRPGRWVVPESALREQAAVLLRRVGARDLRLDVPLRVLSRGQRQLVAVARALLTPPRLLVMDEPTASLGVAESALVESILREAREAGASVLLATHDLEQVFTLADRIVVLRDGAVVADVSPVEVQRSDIVALMSGVEADSIASRQIRRLQSLADQLSEAEPAASLPLIVSAMAGALEVDMLCVHLLETTGDQPVLRRLAATGLPAGLLGLNAALPVGAEGGPAGLAAAGGAVVVVDDLLARSAWPAGTAAAAASGVRSAWAAPILGSDGVLGTVSGYATSPGNPAPERLELATIYLALVVSAAANCLSRGPALRVQVTGGLEPVWADHDRLEQVFVNLLENAASHGASPRGTDVTVRAGGAPGWAEVQITDYGAGIPAGLAEKIFEPRVRGTTEVAGTGLGLPIARGIVEAHGGTLVVAPADPGASFVVALPADPPPGAAGEPAGASWNVVEEPEEQRGG